MNRHHQSLPPQVRLDSTTNDLYGRYQPTPFTGRLSQPPRILKNRYLDQNRHRLRRSNDEYGQFWDPYHDAGSGGGSPGRRGGAPAGLTSEQSNRQLLPLTRGLADRKGAESVSFWNDPQFMDDFTSAQVTPTPVDKHPNAYEGKHFSTQSLTPRSPELNHREPQPYRETAALPPIPREPSGRTARRSSPRPSSGDGDDLFKFIDQYKLHVGIANRGQSSIRVPDIRCIDLQLHLQDNSSVTIKAVPFTFH